MATSTLGHFSFKIAFEHASDLHPDQRFSTASEIICTYHMTIHVSINRKRTVCCAVGCLVADCLNNSLSPAHAGIEAL